MTTGVEKSVAMAKDQQTRGAAPVDDADGGSMTGVEPSDQILVARVLAGDDAAFVLLYRRHAAPVAARLRGILGRPADAEDMLQATFLEVHRSLARYQPEREFGGWVHGIAMNVVRRFLRARSRRWWQWSETPHNLEITAETSDPSAEILSMRAQLARQMYRAMDDLPVGMRLAFTLHEVEGLGLAEIGATLGVSPQAVWAQVQRARKRLQKHLKQVRASYGAGEAR